jgi:flagellar hook-associated protein 2
MNLNSTSSTSNNRITGLATGLDVDSLVKSSIKPYQTKVDKQIQSKEVLEIKQKLYRDLMADGNSLYNKYFDVSKNDSLLFSNNYSSASFDSNNLGVVTATGIAGAKVDNYSVQVQQIARGAHTDPLDLTTLKNNNVKALSFTYNSKTVSVDISAATDNESLANIINNSLSSLNMKATYSQFDKGVVVETKDTGKGEKFDMATGVMTNNVFSPTTTSLINNGTNLHATITNSKKQTITYDDTNLVSNKNTVTVDGVQFAFHTESKQTAGVYESTTITGKPDVSGIKSKIVSFVKDYNAYMEKMNKLLNDKRDRSYQPLTAEQKKDMSTDEIKLWNEKVETGQLRRDDDITRISNSLRNSSKDPIEGVSLYLEKIGITPSNDYGGNKIGTFTINDAKLEQALQDDPEGVMNLFTARPSDATNLSDKAKYNQSGIFYRMKDILYNEFGTSGSSLGKKVGLANSSTVVNNDMSKSILKYETKIKSMQSDLTRRQQALYTKYANLETVMNKYNSQQSFLTSQMSGGQ